jgi:hypothetical protein
MLRAHDPAIGLFISPGDFLDFFHKLIDQPGFPFLAATQERNF